MGKDKERLASIVCRGSQGAVLSCNDQHQFPPLPAILMADTCFRSETRKSKCDSRDCEISHSGSMHSPQWKTKICVQG